MYLYVCLQEREIVLSVAKAVVASKVMKVRRKEEEEGNWGAADGASMFLERKVEEVKLISELLKV